jgi:hypothetical protein
VNLLAEWKCRALAIEDLTLQKLPAAGSVAISRAGC